MSKTAFDFVDQKSIPAFSAANKAGLTVAFQENGAVFSIAKKDILINQALGSPVEGGLGGLFLRVLDGGKVSHFPVVGPRSSASFSRLSDGAAWAGEADGLSYSVSLRLAADVDAWFWTADVRNDGPRARTVDLVLAQDIGIATFGAVRNNEAYTSQYIDHTALKHAQGGVLLASRQNQKQPGGFPWLLHGCLEGAVAWLTDGFQFYGLSYKETGVPAALALPKLPSTRLQYEFALPTLQSKPVRLAPGASARRTFFALYQDDHAAASSPKDAGLFGAARAAYARLGAPSLAGPVHGSRSWFDAAPLFPTRDLTPAEAASLFGKDRRHEEAGLSFFHGDANYAVMKKKELRVERPHGHIMLSGRHVTPSDALLSTTGWAFGAFHSHVTVGNTSFNKLLSISRSHLNVLRSGGLRVFVRSGDGYRLLGLPSAFEIGLNHMTWVYKGKAGPAITVKAWTSVDRPAAFLEVVSDEAVELLLSLSLVLGNHELEHTGRVEVEGGVARFVPNGFMTDHYPGARFHVACADPKAVSSLGGDENLYLDGRRRNGPFFTIKTRAVRRFALTIGGSLAGEAASRKAATGALEDPKSAQRAASARWADLRGGAALALRGEDGVEKLNDLLPWYAHNAVVHFTSPHGLEQYSGAAWGLRDVCQGPAEFLVATRRFKELRETLKVVFSHQSKTTGDWPQWFMFDRYRKIRAGDSHGDIVIWPIKALCEYVESTGDFSILAEKVPFTDDKTGMPAAGAADLWAHVEKEIAAIHAGCVKGTALYHYGHGDWEDTLQPADPGMRDHMVSTWTVELCYQTLRRFAVLCRRAGRPAKADEIDAFCDRIRADFNRLLVKDGVAAGLVYFKGGKPDYMLHPRDNKTGVKYRLLPMTRGMISRMWTKEQARAHLDLIRRHLLFPDGVRLTDRPIPYKGGVEKYFKRAESASNFGREIGMQYVHAHIRYVEAMAALGEAEAAYQGLLTIAPITAHKAYKTAALRQSNAYFSSSDADFPDRPTAERRFGDIKALKVPIKAGWRVYSSGPGIYYNQLVSNVLGLRRRYDDVVFDPVLPKRLDGLTYTAKWDGKTIRYVFRVKQSTSGPSRVVVNGAELQDLKREPNPYRTGALLADAKSFFRLLKKPVNVVEIHI